MFSTELSTDQAAGGETTISPRSHRRASPCSPTSDQDSRQQPGMVAAANDFGGMGQERMDSPGDADAMSGKWPAS